MGIISTVVNAGKTLGRTGGNIINTVKKYNQKKYDQVLKANQKSAILNKPKTAPKPKAPKTHLKGQKPSEFNQANKGAFAKPKAEPTPQEVATRQKLMNDYGFSPHHKEKIKL